MADDEVIQKAKPKESECPPCLPGWFATYSDMVTLLLTFFVLLLSFAKTETSKYEAALGSLREAFGGNVFKMGEVVQKGKSPDDNPTMIESQQPVKPFPIDFLTMEGILDKHEINRSSTEDLKRMKEDLKDHGLTEAIVLYEMPEGIQVRVKDKIYFKEGDIKTVDGGISIEIYEKVAKLLSKGEWTLFVEAHSSLGEQSSEHGWDAFMLSSQRAAAVTRNLIKKGVPPRKITTVFYGDTRPVVIPNKKPAEVAHLSRRVEFMVRKIDLGTEGHKVSPH